ncbi:membrane protein, partial [mine drainage metagenome]
SFEPRRSRSHAAHLGVARRGSLPAGARVQPVDRTRARPWERPGSAGDASMTGGPVRRGPLVHRAVHHGAALLVFGAVEFIVGMIVTQSQYAGYSLTQNYISDLGATTCGTWGGSGSFLGHYACSPWHLVFNVSIVVMGLALIGAALLLRTAFPPRRSRTIGLALLLLVGVGSIGVGLSPENVNITV